LLLLHLIGFLYYFTYISAYLTEHLSHSKYTELYIYQLQLLIMFVLQLQKMHFSSVEPSSVSFSNIYMNDLLVLPICY